MDKENNRNAAGLRRSAVAERIRLREEWSALKGTTDMPHPTTRQGKPNNILNKKSQNINQKIVSKQQTKAMVHTRSASGGCDALRGVVALVEVGAEPRALALRAALGALGASVVPAWNPLVTHLVWAEGGCRAARARARALASRLMSPLWVEACAAAARRLPERAFPAAARPSDLPSPRTMRTLLKQADMENIPLVDLLSVSKESDVNGKPARLRISSETELDTSADKTTDTSNDTIDVQSRVNTAPRRAVPAPPPAAAKSRRRLFTQREPHHDSSQDSGEEESRVAARLTQRERKGLAHAERSARRLARPARPARPALPAATPRIVVSGMCRGERRLVCAAVRALRGRLQARVTRRTTHVLLGPCAPAAPAAPAGRTENALAGAARGCRVLHGQWAVDSHQVRAWLHHHGYEVTHLKKISQKARAERKALGRMRAEYAYDVFSGMRVRLAAADARHDAAQRLLALCGALVFDHSGNLIQDGAQAQNDRLTQHVRRPQNGDLTQNGGTLPDYDITIGTGHGEVSSKWVFDSVAAARMRTTRRYVNNSSFVEVFDSQR